MGMTRKQQQVARAKTARKAPSRQMKAGMGRQDAESARDDLYTIRERFAAFISSYGRNVGVAELLFKSRPAAIRSLQRTWATSVREFSRVPELAALTHRYQPQVTQLWSVWARARTPEELMRVFATGIRLIDQIDDAAARIIKQVF